MPFDAVLWALCNDTRLLASPDARALCPACRSEVLSKCGDIVSWHWAHVANHCDPWHEPESEWHRYWKSQFPNTWQEVRIGNHIADVKAPRCVIEFQASPISPAEIAEREAHYRPMIWVLRAEDFRSNLNFRWRDSYHSFRWKWPRQSWFAASMPIFFDLGDPPFDDDGELDYGAPTGLFRVHKLHSNLPCGGWGHFIPTNKLFLAAGFYPTPVVS